MHRAAATGWPWDWTAIRAGPGKTTIVAVNPTGEIGGKTETKIRSNVPSMSLKISIIINIFMLPRGEETILVVLSIP
jgi:hypothetical protein